MTVTTDNIRKNFPLLQQMDTIYLDNAATAQRPSCVLAAVQEFYEQKKCKSSARLLSFKPGGDGELSGGKKDRTGVIHAEEPEEIFLPGIQRKA